jgi:hypothetical protein
MNDKDDVKKFGPGREEVIRRIEKTAQRGAS